MTAFTETDERRELRKAVAALAAKYGQEYFRTCAKEGRKTDELWQEAGKLGFIGVNLPEEFGGGGAGMYELSIVMEEIAAAGTGLLMLVVSPAICGNIIVRYGTDEQKQRWVPGLADGSYVMAFGITEPDAGSNSHRITTTARRDGNDWILSGQKVWISGVDQAQAVLVVGRHAGHLLAAPEQYHRRILHGLSLLVHERELDVLRSLSELPETVATAIRIAVVPVLNLATAFALGPDRVRRVRS